MWANERYRLAQTRPRSVQACSSAAATRGELGSSHPDRFARPRRVACARLLPLISRLVLALCVCCVAALVSAAAGFGEAPESREPARPVSLTERSLVVAGLEALDEGEQARDAQTALHNSPQAFVAREVSRAAYERMSAGRAAELAARTYPSVVEQPAAGPPALAGDQTIVKYVSDHAAQLALPRGRHGLIVSAEPIASETPHGRDARIDLGLTSTGGSFEAKTPLVPIRIVGSSNSAQLIRSGVTLSALDGGGAPAGNGKRIRDGASVFYANTETDSDTLARPILRGFELDSLLRSARSPQLVHFRVGLPAGARLISATASSRAVQVVHGGTVIATISVPGARDAEGTPVPVWVSVSGQTLTVTVEHRSSTYRYPILLDPTAEENAGGSGKILFGKTWGFTTNNINFRGGYPGSCTEYQCGAEDTIEGAHESGETGAFHYKTQGLSRIYSFTATTSYVQTQGNRMENLLAIANVHGGGFEGTTQSWVGPYGPTEASVSSSCGCATGEVNASNDESEAIFEQNTREPSVYGFEGKAKLWSARVGIVQEAPPTARWDLTDGNVGSSPNAMYPSRWINKPTATAAGLDGFDPGVGIYREYWSSPAEPSWHGEAVNSRYGEPAQRGECGEPNCPNGESSPPQKVALPALPDGEDTINGIVEDTAGIKATASRAVKIDQSPPTNIHLDGLPASNEVTYGEQLQAEATDRYSGVAWLELQVDGRKVGTRNGSCSPGSCTATGTWTLKSEAFREPYGVGKHQVKIIATDAAGNSESATATITLVSTESKSVGPGAVNLETGAFTVAATDVSISAPDAGLSVERSYNSYLLGGETEGPFGPQWRGLSFAGAEKLTKLATGSVVLTAGGGQNATFAKEGSSFVGPAGDAGLTLKEEAGGVFALTDQKGDVTKFALPEGGSGSVLTPVSREEPGHAGAVSYSFKAVGAVLEPTRVLAPVPAGVECTTLVRGCRALAFTYGSATKAGEAPEEWGEYTGRLMRVSFTAWDPSKGEHGEMSTVPVAQYAYDKQGRLRAEWDPRVEGATDCGKGCPALKTLYGYDSEGHLTAIAAPGVEPWLMHYGATESDPSTGRLLSITRPPATAKLGGGLAPVASEAPRPSSSSPSELSVSPGAWKNEPLIYAYQWQRCNAIGSECAAIPGATNQTYTLRPGDGEHTLAALVTATNAGGSTTTSSLPSEELPPTTEPTYSRLFGEAERRGREVNPTDLQSPSYIAVGDGNRESSESYYGEREFLYLADTGNGKLKQFRLSGSPVAQIATPTPVGVAVSQGGFETLRGREIWVSSATSKQVTHWDEPYGWGYGEHLVEQGHSSVSGTSVLGGLTGDHAPGSHDNGVFAAQSGEVSQIDHVNTYGEHETSFGSTGSGPGQLNQPSALATNPVSGYLYVTDTGNNRVEYFEAWGKESGKYIGQFGKTGSGPGEFTEPKGIAVDTHGNVWVVDSGNGRVQEFSPKGRYLGQIGVKSQRATREEREAQIRTELASLEPKARKAREKREQREEKKREKREKREDPGETRREREEEEYAPGQLTRPIGIALDAERSVYVVDSGDARVESWSAPSAPTETALAPATPPGSGSCPAEPPRAPGTPPSAGSCATWTIAYRVPVSGEGAPYPLGANDVAAWSQEQHPASGTAIFPPDEPMGRPAADYKRATIYYMDAAGRTVNTAAPGGGITTTEYNTTNNVVRTLSADNRDRALKAGTESANVARKLAATSEYNDSGTELRNTLGPLHPVRLANGEKVEARAHTEYSYDQGAPSAYGLVTERSDEALYSSGPNTTRRADGRVTTTSYSGQEGLGWKLRKPTSVTTDPGTGRVNLTHTTLYDPATGNMTETRLPANSTESSPHANEAIYYTAGANSKNAACGGHPEWANMTCITGPAKQPETAGLPKLAITKLTYNVWDEPLVTEETFASTTRTTTASYDVAGRLTLSKTSSSGMASVEQADSYSPELGVVVEQSSASEGTARTIASEYDKLGRLVTYTDADGNIATYAYDVDGRSTTINDGKGTQTYGYDSVTGDLTKLVDSAAGTFTAKYDPEGLLLTEAYPNGMNANYTYDPTGSATALAYEKTSSCRSACPETLFSDSVEYSIHGQWLVQHSTLSSQVYTYDEAGRLTQVQNTPAGKGCTTRIYVYDADTNRRSLETRPPEGTSCATKAGGTIETHTYDEADRLIDPGARYNEAGDITALPAPDAGGSELTSEYYADNQPRSIIQHESEAQKEETIGYRLDPAGRTRETIATGKVNTSDTISHYAGTGDAPAWTAGTSGGEWTRNISDVGGALAATQSNGQVPELQLANLHGDIVATVKDEEAAAGLTSRVDTSEFGVPTTSQPPRYSWLGANQRPTELTSGVIAMGVRTYVPELGRFLQPDPVSGGSANAYSYTFGDPVNTSDPSGAFTEYTIGGPSIAVLELISQHAADAVAQQAAENAAARAAAERAYVEAVTIAYAAGEATGQEETGEEEGGDPIATIATRAKTAEGRFAEWQCDKERDRLEKKGYEIGDFTGRMNPPQPGGRYPGTSYELLYATHFVFLASAPPSLIKESTCHVIVAATSGGHHRVTHGPHFRIGRGLEPTLA
jgi:RHS repeat-associated protein